MNEPSWTARVEAYINYRRSLGFSLSEPSVLKQFGRFADQIGLMDPLTTEMAVRWARTSKRQDPITWTIRLQRLRAFAKFCKRFDASTEIPPGDTFGITYRRPVPHIFTDGELISLLESAQAYLRPPKGLRPITCRTIFGLLAATGMRISEALKLSRSDVDLNAGVLLIQEAKCHTKRLVPLHPTVTAELESYAQLRDRHVRKPKTEHFFLMDNGQPPTRPAINLALRTLCKKLGWQPRGDHRHHRLHDMRHSAIVRSLLRFYRKGIDIDHALLALSVYVGHATVANTYWYVTGVPDLMEIASS
jgi:integrase